MTALRHLRGLGDLSTLTFGDLYDYFMCGIEDPSTMTMSSRCAAFWQKMNPVTPSTGINYGTPVVPPEAYTAPYSPPVGYTPPLSATPQETADSFFGQIPTPTPTLDYTGLLMLVGGVLVISMFAKGR